MAGPNDYSIPQPNIAGSLLGGIAAGQQLGAQQAAQNKAAMYSADLQNYLQNPTASSASAMIAKYPESQKALSASFDIYDKGQKEDIFKSGTQAYSAIQNGRPEIALGILDERIKAAENSGQDTKDLVSLKQSIQQDPRGAGAGLALTMSALNPDGWSKIASEQRSAAKAPAELSLAESKAQKAGVDAKYAESNAAKDLEKKGMDIWKIGQDVNIAKLNSQIAAMNAESMRQRNGIASEANNLKQQDLNLKIQDKVTARDTAVRAKADEAETGANAINGISSLLGEILGDEDSLRAASGTLGIRGAIPGTKARSTAGKLDQLRDSLAASNLDKLKGPMSDKDIEFLRRLAGNLDRYQDEDQLIKELNRLNEFLPSSMDKLNSKYGSTFTLQKNAQGIENDTGAPPPGAVRRIN
jgi:hypothetical protein